MNALENLLVKKQNHVCYITFNREQQLNALNTKTFEELSTVLDDIAQDQDIWGVIVTGAGSKAFIAGADIKEFQSLNEEEGRLLAASGHKVMDRIYNFDKPVIAAINGFALGGGLELALACHMRVAAVSAKLGLPEASLGLIPGYGGTQRLTDLVGRGKAMEMILSGNMITSEEALSWGVVNHVTETENLLSKAEEILTNIFSRSKTSVKAAIRAINASISKEEDGYKIEISEFGKCFGQPDFIEGVAAFVEKRKPNF
ncbi:MULTISPECIES: enoyl-CoA hydratase/isomerase family protein [unclassified Sphingobacterium]|uniref:enoyl-CoA hydratase/isomerase family protein n=1 Tax=unclassified Sphingobacterium TaxID=2609468 RepID=UPI0025DDCBFA|nr:MULTISPECIES: enoyl-CoA hydratase-related protein [unclassified Sphingobacterium]